VHVCGIGPNAQWEYIRQISALIPGQQRIKDHILHTINHFGCGKSHTSPEKEEDVQCLQMSY
jgi:hypothetical protein